MSGRMRRRWARGVAKLLWVGALCGLQGCQTHEDAVAAAQQMAETAATMQRFYVAEDTLATSTEGLLRAQSDLLGVPVSATTVAHLNDVHLEMQQRIKLAHAVAELAGAFAEITNSQAADDAAKAAGDLNAQLVALKVEPDSDAAAKGLQAAVASLVNLLRAHDEVKAAKVLLPMLHSLCAFYDAEKPAYVSLAVTFYTTAASNAGVLIDQGKVALGQRYRTSLEPFGLLPDVRADALSAAAREEMKRGVSAGEAERKQESREAADALGEALHRMEARVDLVASHKAMRVRVPPLSLSGVRTWLTEIEAETGVKL